MRDLNNVLKLGFELQIPYADAADQIDHKDWAGSLRKLVKSYQSINDLRRDIKSLNELKRNKPEQLLEILRYSIEQADISKNIIPEIFDNDDKALKFIKSRKLSIRKGVLIQNQIRHIRSTDDHLSDSSLSYNYHMSNLSDHGSDKFILLQYINTEMQNHIDSNNKDENLCHSY